MDMRWCWIGLFAAACATEDVTVCAGEGPQELLFGAEAVSGFEALTDGDELVVTGASPDLSIPLAWSFTGLDTSEGIDILVRIWFTQSTEDYLDSAIADCTEPGPALITASAPIPSELQSDAAATLGGQAVRISGSLTDAHGVTLSHDDTVTLTFP